MSRPARNKLSPWIESLIQSYDREEDNCSNNGRLKAHVIGTGELSLSQAQSCDGLTGFLHLSDGVVKIHAVLTATAWEHLQEQEDRESLSSLRNTTVCIQDYRLLFHMGPEQTKCNFFLSVGELVTTAAGPVKDSTPCCTTLSSVKLKICKTWMALLGQDEQESQKSQCGFDLTELLGEWQHECLQDVLDDVRERLIVARSPPVSEQPSTSTCHSAPVQPDTLTATSWDVDRIKYKGEPIFSVPVMCLLIPEDTSGSLTTSEDREANVSVIIKQSENIPSSVGEADWIIPEPVVEEREHHTDENPTLSEEDEDMAVMMIDCNIRPLSNPWDIFPPPCGSSSSSNTSPIQTQHRPITTTEHPVIVTSTQFSIHGSKETKGEQSFFPPYQEPPPSTSFTATATSDSVSQPEPFARPSDLSPAAVECHTHTVEPEPVVLDEEGQILDMQEETDERNYRKAKRKRSEPGAKVVSTLVEEEQGKAQISASPPSWLFETPMGPTTVKGSGHLHGQAIVPRFRKTPTVHSDGKPFSYSYKVSGQNLIDMSQFKVSQELLHWAVKYLVVPKQTDNPQNTSVTSVHTSSLSTNITSL